MRRILAISDLHLGHSNILHFTDDDGALIRGDTFKSIEEHDECIVDNWNSEVRDGDIIYCLGDVYFGEGWKHLDRLRGKKRLVLGNHDNGKDARLAKHFGKILESRSIRELGVIMTHRPIFIGQASRTGINKFPFNVHGHIHENASPTPNHFNVSCEAVSYRPVDVSELLFGARL